MKMELLAGKLARILPLTRCPQCGTGFHLQGTSVCCENRHCYDLSAKGYLNLAPEHPQTKDKYNAMLFRQRRFIMENRFYLPLCDRIAELLGQCFGASPFTFVDVGCGEGSHTKRLAERFPEAAAVGTDLNRDAIMLAASGGSKPIWLICDLKKLPFLDHSCDFLLDILTPADYSEFSRVLKQDGYLLKVMPGPDYLREIRQACASWLSGGENYRNQDVWDHLKQHADIVNEGRVYDTFPLSPDESAAFLRMTPMTFSVPENVLTEIQLSHITVDMRIALCRFSRNR